MFILLDVLEFQWSFSVEPNFEYNRLELPTIECCYKLQI